MLVHETRAPSKREKAVNQEMTSFVSGLRVAAEVAAWWRDEPQLWLEDLSVMVVIEQHTPAHPVLLMSKLVSTQGFHNQGKEKEFWKR